MASHAAPIAAPTTASSVASACESRRDLPTLAHHEHAVAHREHLREVGGDEDDRHAGGGELVDDVVDLGLRGDVDAAGRLVEDEDLRLRVEPLREHRLLLVAAGQALDGRVERRRADRELLAEPFRGRTFGAAVEQPQPVHVVAERREGHVRRDRLRQREPEAPAILRDVRDPRAQRLSRRPRRVPLPRQLCATFVGRRDAEEREPDVGPARADEAREPEHLALADLEADPREDAAPPEPVDAEDDVARLLSRARKEVGEVPADHVLDRLCLRHLGDGPAGDEAAVAKDGDAVGDLEDFLEAVADEEHRDPGRGQQADLLEELADLVGGERRGRLVHDQHADVERERLRDLDGLLLRDGEAARGRPDVEVDVDPAEDRLRVVVQPLPADERAAVLVADEDVLGDVEVGEDRGLLVDRGDARTLRLGRAIRTSSPPRRSRSSRCRGGGCPSSP